MELFIFGLDEVDDICGSRDSPNDVCERDGMTCSSEGEVEGFWWSLERLKKTGALGLHFLPGSMNALKIICQTLRGSIHLADLPEKMKKLAVRENHLSGSLELNDLPAGMEDINLSSNEFTGKISFKNLPEGLKVLLLGKNQLS